MTETHHIAGRRCRTEQVPRSDTEGPVTNIIARTKNVAAVPVGTDSRFAVSQAWRLLLIGKLEFTNCVPGCGFGAGIIFSQSPSFSVPRHRPVHPQPNVGDANPINCQPGAHAIFRPSPGARNCTNNKTIRPTKGSGQRGRLLRPSTRQHAQRENAEATDRRKIRRSSKRFVPLSLPG